MLRLFRIEHEGSPRYVAERAGTWRLIEGDPFGKFKETIEIDREDAKVLAPVLPSKIVCVGLNYKDHALEQNKPLPEEPLIFLKPSTSVIGPDAPIEAPAWAGRVDHEAELGLVISRTARGVKAAKAYDYVGLTAVNDVDARSFRTRMASARCKGFDTFAPIGPVSPSGLTARSPGSGVRQRPPAARAHARAHLHDSRAQSRFISSVATLLPGDIISTGTPSGIGPIRPGDNDGARRRRRPAEQSWWKGRYEILC